MTNFEVVRNLERDLIGTVKTLYDKINLGEDDVLEFKTPFVLQVPEYDPETGDRYTVPAAMCGMMGNYMIVGTHQGEEYEFPVDTVDSVFGLAHIADLLEEKAYTIKVF